MPRPPLHTVPTSSAAALLQQLRDMKRKAEEADVESSAARERWLDAVETLLRAVRGWLQRANDEELARIDAATVHVADDDVGAYDAPALKITLPGPRVVWVRPVGTLRVGAQGIVDIVCGSSRALLVLNRAGTWKIRSPGPSAPLVPLDEQAFARALAELIL
jgi:hypothetical protein